MSFVVFSLPRSRSTWLSVFLAYGARRVSHDLGIECKTAGEFLSKIHNGTCETGAAFAWRLIHHRLPEAHFAVVLRPIDEVARSLERFGFGDQTAELEERQAHLLEIAALPQTLTVQYDDLRQQAVCAQLFDHCNNAPMSALWWRKLDALNIQVDMPRQIERLRANADRIAILKAEVCGSMAHV